MKIPPWSHSFLASYKVCPHQAYRRYVARDLPKVETPALKWGIEVHDAMELRIALKEPLPDGMLSYEPFAAAFDGRVCSVELKLGITKEGRACDFFAKEVFGRGKLDVVYCPAKGAAFLTDWKTGKVREDPAELKVGALLLHARFPELEKISGVYVWLSESRLGVPYDVSDTSSTWLETCRTVAEMRSQEGAWEKTPQVLCGWCEVKDCEHNRSGK